MRHYRVSLSGSCHLFHTTVVARAAATDLLGHHLERERIPAVVRRKAPELSGKSLLELAIAGEYTRVRSVVETMFDLRRVQP